MAETAALIALQNVSADKRCHCGEFLGKMYIPSWPTYWITLFEGFKLSCEPVILRMRLLLSIEDELVLASPVRCHAFLHGS